MNLTNSQNPLFVNVAVIGGGPAGAVVALQLAKAGVSAAIIERKAGDSWKIGEGLPPAAKPNLQQLNLWERFIADEHLASYGNCSAWGSSELVDHSFVFNPHGCGWHLDRNRFDQMLLNATTAAGAKLFSPVTVTDCQQADSGWRLELKTNEKKFVGTEQGLFTAEAQRTLSQRRDSGENLCDISAMLCDSAVKETNWKALFQGHSLGIKTDFVVEASGRGSWFARRQGAKRINHDKLIGLAALLKAEGWQALLDRTDHLRKRIERYGYRIELEPQIVSANSSHLDFTIGESWLAVGDAAVAFDPLSSQGIVTAMESGILAAEAILSGQEALKNYSRRLEQVFATYLANKNFYYLQERRWPDSTFWLRRHGAMI